MDIKLRDSCPSSDSEWVGKKASSHGRTCDCVSLDYIYYITAPEGLRFFMYHPLCISLPTAMIGGLGSTSTTQEFKMTNCRRHKFTASYEKATCTFRALNRHG